MAADFEIRGEAELRRKLRRLEKEVPKEFAAALFRQGEFVMGDSREKLAPVDDSTLQATGRVHAPQTRFGFLGGEIVVRLSYGSSATPYALAIHEHPSGHSPPSWQGKTLRFTKPGTGHKYLERPIMKKRATLLRDLADDVNLERLVR